MDFCATVLADFLRILYKHTDKILYLARHYSPFQPHTPNPPSTRAVEDQRGIYVRGVKIGGDVMIWGLWDRQTDAIINVKLGDADADTYRF